MDEEIPQLTTGACDQIVSSTGPGDPVWSTSPVLQVVRTRSFETGETGERTLRWAIILSDGTHALQALVVAKLASLFENGEVRKGSVIRVRRYAANTIQNIR